MASIENNLISVIIVNWNGKHHLEECLSSLSRQTFKNFESILVDNGSTDGSVKFVSEKFPDIRIVTLEQNEGFCIGNNIGLQHSTGEFVALLNNDTRVEPHWLAELLKEMLGDPKIGICASCMINYFQPDLLDTAGDGYDICGVGFKIGNGFPESGYRDKRYVFAACAGGALYRRSMTEEIDFFDEDFFAVGEDLDLSFRAKLAGYKCIYVPNAVVNHKINQTVGPGSDFLLYHARRNVEYTYFKNMPLALLLLMWPIHLVYNLLTFAQALWRGRLSIFLKAKRDFLASFIKICKK
ncbi:glycosyltransferase family 2 protein, partial [bacterium]|nr:glycosyltransferase family 2 protein [bacterium]